MAGPFDLPHIDLASRLQSTPFTSGVNNTVGVGTLRTREDHGNKLRGELAQAYQAFEAQRQDDERLGEPEGVFLEVELRPGTAVETVERKRDGFATGAAKASATNYRTVGVFIPEGAREVFNRILDEYQNGPLTDTGNPKQKAFIEPIESIRAARFETFWTDSVESLPPPGTEIWWEVWCYPSREDELDDMVLRLGVRAAEREKRLYFPEHVVIPVLATRAAIELILFTKLAIIELRRANDSPSFFIDDIDRETQDEFTEDFANRIAWPPTDVPVVCLLDTGVNRAHMLIEPTLSQNDLLTIDPAWGAADTPVGHGTGMAGLAIYGDLTSHLAGTANVQLTHRLESVKLVPPPGFPATQEQFYGSITKQAVALPEIGHPDRPRVFCMAVTNENRSGIRPTTWSAAIDQEASGVVLGGPKAPKRLFVVSAGNAPNPIDMAQVVDSDHLEIEDPAQAWNALTVGGYTDLVNIQEPHFAGFTPFAPAGEISPYTRTSTLWTQGKSPFKPDIVMEAGNRVVSPANTDVYDSDSLALLSTGANVAQDSLVSFRATSAATAQASRLAAKLMAEYPEFWPETIRALIVHAAEWTPCMLDQLHAAPTKSAAYALLRRFGHGVPTFERAVASAKNHLALTSQAEIQPYKRAKGMNECHFYSLPWPRAALESLGDQDIRLKVTLSYFVEPNPGSSASFDPLRYQSFGLRFDLKRRDETVQNFGKRINKKARVGAADKPPRSIDNDNWLFGPNAISAGSLHSDEWTGPAVNLLNRNIICIRPIGGWWNNRADANVRSQKARYALILSLKSDDQTIDLHTPISTLISAQVGIENITIPI